MRTHVPFHVIRGQIAFWLFTLMCVGMHPGFVLKSNEGGLSNYGIHVKTFVPYTLALTVTALFSLRAARHLNGQALDRGLAWVLRSYGVLLLIVLVSTYPYSLNAGLRDVHFTLGIALALAEVVGAAWMFHVARQGPVDVACLAVQWVGLVLLVLTGFSGLHLLFASQITMAAGFGGLLMRATNRIVLPARETSGS
jgi:hypothetical protein